MRNNLIWTLFLILPCVLVTSRPATEQRDASDAGASHALNYSAPDELPQDVSTTHQEQVISTRITSSVAIGRGKGKRTRVLEKKLETPSESDTHTPLPENTSTVTTERQIEELDTITTELAPSGANIEFLKQLHSKKEARGLHNFEKIHSFPFFNTEYNETNDSIAEGSIKSVLEINSSSDDDNENVDNVPLARSVLSASSKNYIQGLPHKQLSERGNSRRLTTVSYVVHDTSKVINNYNEPSDSYISQRDLTDPPKYYEAPKFYSEAAKVYSEPARVYSEPAKYYSEPAKIYSEPAKIYSEPAKVYSEPAKVYSVPARVYSEPAKFYSQPASLHLTPEIPQGFTPWRHSQSPVTTTPITTVTYPPDMPSTQRIVEQQPEKNYEVDEKISVITDGRSHGVQDNCKQENCKVGYVVEGKQYRKYRVEERTSDGYIVGEYGVVRNEDGALRGVRYTADGDASPRLICDALMKFLQLK